MPFDAGQPFPGVSETPSHLLQSCSDVLEALLGFAPVLAKFVAEGADRPFEAPDRPFEAPDRPFEAPDRSIEAPDGPFEAPDGSLDEFAGLLESLLA